MSYFIDQIAQHIYDEDLDLNHLVVVLPSQRAKKYLQRALFKAYQKPIVSPRIITMNAWIQECTPFNIIDNTRALFKLYEVHKVIDKNPNLDEFLKWGQTLLSDFDEIDRYLINSEDLFKNLADIKDIENWSFSDETVELSKGQKRFMEFWDTLKDYYKIFNQEIEKTDEYYAGKAYKYVANNIDSVFKEDKEAYFIFAGFNALSPAETSIIKQLRTMGKAEIFIDADEYYLNSSTHEAGRFLRKLQKDLGTKNLPFVVDKIQKDNKNIKVFNCAQATGQAKISAKILHDDIPQDEFSETLLMLADEKLVVPVIKNIPQNVGNSNITLGLPLKNTAVKSWVELMFNVQEHYLQFTSKQIYHKDFIRFIKHPFLLGIYTEEEEKEINKVEANILNKNWIFIFPESLNISPRIKKLITLFFSPWDKSFIKTPQTINEINELLLDYLDREKNEIEASVIYHFNQAIERFATIIEEFKPNINLGTFKVLFNQHWVNESIAYYGNPLGGLQIMGLLETRLLDFKNVIIVGLNEGSLPPTNPIQTLIPMDLRRYHTLPTPREKQGLFAHHFYRLLHHAENVWISYSSADRDMGGIDEISRYILQLELELSHTNKNIAFETFDYAIVNKDGKTTEVIVKKSPAIIQRLDEYFAHRTSASALKTALRCPLDFYYKYLIGMGEEKSVEEDVEASTFGSFIHDTLEILYGRHAQFDKDGNKQNHTNLVRDDFDKMLREHKGMLTSRFYKFFNYSDQQKIEGKNYLSLEMAIYLTEQYLKQEQRDLEKLGGQLFINSVERILYKTLPLNINGEEKEIKFVGVLDRIDEINGKKRIIDYKTGRCVEDDVKISRLRKKDVDEDMKVEHLVGRLKNSKYVFQLLIYNMLFHEEFGYYPDKVGLVSMVNLKESPLYLINELTETIEELMELFEKALTIVISDLYNEDNSFAHDIDSKYCDYCVV